MHLASELEVIPFPLRTPAASADTLNFIGVERCRRHAWAKGTPAMGMSWLADSESSDPADVARQRSYRPRHALPPPGRRIPLAALRLLRAVARRVSRPGYVHRPPRRPGTSTQPLPRVVA